MLYLAFKVLHVLAVVGFLGNITTGLFWKHHADRTRDPRILLHTLDGLIRSDRIFTVPGVVLILSGGFGAAIVGGLPLLRTGWIFWAIVLFTLAGIAFSARVAPAQVRMARLMRHAVETGAPDWDAYHAQSRAWDAWGAFALVTPLAALLLMVFKPAVPGL